MKLVWASVLSPLLLIMGCSSTPIQYEGNTALLSLCTGLPVPKAGVTNESLAEGFLEARAGMLTCQDIINVLTDVLTEK